VTNVWARDLPVFVAVA